MKIQILVACHRQYWLPSSEIYLPIEVGASAREDLKLRGVRDNTKTNISSKNPNYCELTAVYWAWKNLAPDVTHVGLVHYRRYFGKTHWFGSKKDGIFQEKDFSAFLQRAPVLLPPKRNYFIETVQSQYEHAHHPEDLRVLRKVLKDLYPLYLPAFDRVMAGRRTHIFNMFVMRRDIFDRYAAWLFDVLFHVEQELDISAYSKNDARVFGFLSERLLDVWIETNGIPYKEIPLLLMEPTNWFKKGTNFLLRKYFPSFSGKDH